MIARFMKAECFLLTKDYRYYFKWLFVILAGTVSISVARLMFEKDIITAVRMGVDFVGV